ncbi:MAG: TRAP transporter substrate-binding protein [Burkholderiales bacterium]|nr:MAG: TRAP transporter substrate-binding protein [Burkholderiales bacterium]
MKTLISLTAGAVIGLGTIVFPASAQTVLTYSSWLPWTHPVNTAIYLPWMEAVEKESNGRIKFRRLPKPVASPPAHLDAVRTGQADVAMSVHGYSPKRFAAYLFAELPMLGDTATGTSVALQRTHDKFLADKGFYEGVHLIGMNTHGPGLIHHSKKHIMSPDDMKGQTMRTGGPVPKAIVEAWGGVAIRQPAPKSYEILSTGVADGITFPYESLGSFKITKLVPFSTYIPGGMYSSSHYLVINKAKYDALAPEDKAVIDKYSGEAFAKMAGQGWDKINDEGKKLALEAGNSIKTAPQALIDAVKAINAPLEADFVKGANEAGVDGAAILKFFREEVARLAAAK